MINKYKQIKQDNGELLEKLVAADKENKKLKAQVRDMDTDLLREPELKEFMRSVATIPYSLKFFDTLVHSATFQKASIPSNESTALDQKQGQINQLRHMRNEVANILKSKEE